MTDRQTVLKEFAEMVASIPSIEKTGFNTHFKSKYVNIESILRTIKPIMKAKGFHLQQRNVHDMDCVAIRTEVVHLESGEIIELGTISVPYSKKDPQAYGSAVTYARRQAIVTAFLLETGDDDGSAATETPEEQQIEGIKRSILDIIKGFGYSDENDIGSIVTQVIKRVGADKKTADGWKAVEHFLSQQNDATMMDFLNGAS